MQDRLKKRLVGIAVIGSLAVVFLPMLLEQEPLISPQQIRDRVVPPRPQLHMRDNLQPIQAYEQNDPSPATPAAPALPFIERNVPITPPATTGHPGGAVAGVPSTLGQPPPVAEIVPITQIPVSAVHPTTPQVDTEVNAAATTSTDPAPAAAETPDPAPSPVADQQQTAPQPPTPTPTPTPTQASIEPPKMAEGVKAWAIQLGSFSDEGNAKGLAAELIAQGMSGFVVPFESNDRKLYRVMAGPQADRAASERDLSRLSGWIAERRLEGAAIKSYP